MSETKRHNTRRNTERPPAQHLGPFRRELLLHLAIREAVTRVQEDKRSVPQVGLTWEPSKALAPGVELTPTLSVKISAALAALEELGFVVRSRGNGQRGRTRAVKVTRKGAWEAVQIANREGVSRTKARRKHPTFGRWQVQSDPVGFLTHAIRAWTEAKKYPHTEEVSYRGNPWWRESLRIARAYVKENPEDDRAAKLLREAEDLIPRYHPTQSQLDHYLERIAMEALWARNTMDGDQEPDVAWLAHIKVFDLALGPLTPYYPF